MASITDIIKNGDVSIYLSAIYNVETPYFSGGSLGKPKDPIMITMVTDALRWGYEGGAQTMETLRGIANYLIWLMGKFGLEASAINGNGGSVSPVPPGGLVPSRIDFEVSASSYMVTGQSIAVIAAFIGYNLDFIRNGVPQSTLSSQPSYFSWDKNTGTFNCSPALLETELIALIPT